MQQHKMQHAEAFSLMTYKCKSCNGEEELWNSRDGVTPFGIACKYCGGEAFHVNFGSDKYLPNYNPYEGQRVFIDMSDDRKKEIAEKRFNEAKGTPYEITEKEKAEFMEIFLTGFHEGEPDVIIWKG